MSEKPGIVLRVGGPALVVSAMLAGFLTGAGPGGLAEQTPNVSLSVVDQMGRASPFFLTGSNSTTSLVATFCLSFPEGSLMPHVSAIFAWKTPSSQVQASREEPLVYVGGRTFMSTSTMEVNLSAFPPSSSTYQVSASTGEHVAVSAFHLCGRPTAEVLRKDFKDYPPGSLPPDWVIESPGYGPGAQWVEEVFGSREHVLRMTSVYIHNYDERRPIEARLSHAVNISASHFELSLRMKTWVEILEDCSQSAECNCPYGPGPVDDLVEASFGLEGEGWRLSLADLGGEGWPSNLPSGFDFVYSKWLDVNIFVDLTTHASSASAYLEGMLMGSKSLPGLRPESIKRVYLELGGSGLIRGQRFVNCSACYVGQFHNIILRQYDLGSGPPSQPVATSIEIRPTHGQWFDPGAIRITYRAQVTPCMSSNPYLEPGPVQVELWNCSGRVATLGTVAWSGTGSCGSPCDVFQSVHAFAVPAEVFISGTEGVHEFDGWYAVRVMPTQVSLPLLVEEGCFHMDDPIHAYFSLWQGGPRLEPPSVAREPGNITVNIEFDPAAGKWNDNQPYNNKNCSIAWIDPLGKIIRNCTTGMRTHASYPTNQSWAFDALPIRMDSPPGIYTCLIKATANSGYPLLERRTFTLVPVGEGPIGMLLAGLPLTFWVSIGKRRSQNAET